MRKTSRTHLSEFGPASVLVRTPGSGYHQDGIVRQEFHTEVHPADGASVETRTVTAFYPWDAANKALEIWKARHPNMESSPGRR